MVSTLEFPLTVLQEAFGNCEVKLKKCDDDPRLRESDRRKLHENLEDYSRYPNNLCGGNITRISIRNCSYTDFDIVLVHDQIIPEEGWTESSLPVYFANFQQIIDISNNNVISDKVGYESKPGSDSEENGYDHPYPSDDVGNLGNTNTLLKITKVKHRKYRCEGCGNHFTKFCNAKRHQRRTCIARSKGCGGDEFLDHKEVVQETQDLISDCLGSNNFTRKDGKFQCDFCKRWFISASNVQVHQVSACLAKPGNNIKMPNGMLKCKYCEKTFALNYALVEHVRSSHLGLRNFKCSLCPKRFNRKILLNAHMIVHTGERRFKCLQCGFKFVRRSGLRHHMLTHTGERPHKCEVCNMKFARKSTLSQHIMTHMANREKLHKCYVCSKSFARKDTLQSHMMIHSNKKPFKCPFCKLRSNHLYSITAHIARFHSNENHTDQEQTHTEVKFQCKLCNKTFSHKRTLQDHEQYVHSDAKPFKCPFCSLRVKRQRALNAHIARFHSNSKWKKGLNQYKKKLRYKKI